jgi:hypothetical protein
MHVLQRIAIQADDKDEAFGSVKANLEAELGGDDYATNSWFDWFVTGGGRWNPNDSEGYDDNDNSMTISYDDEPEKFREAVDVAIQARIDEFNRYRKYFNEKNVDINAYLDKYNGITDYSMELYDLSKMIDMAQGKWDYNSYFFDITNQSTNPEFMFRSIDSGNKNWYIVFVDFHF